MRFDIWKMTILPIAAATLVACGGGNSAAAPNSSTGSTAGSSNSNSNSNSNNDSSTHSVLETGLYRLSYGRGSVNFKKDHSLSRTYMSTYNAGYLEHEGYAGPSKLHSLHSFDYIYDFTKKSSQKNNYVMYGTVVTSSLNTSNTFQLDIGPLNKLPYASYQVTLIKQDLTNTSINDYAKTVVSSTKPTSQPGLSGNFPKNAFAWRIQYKPLKEMLLKERNIWNYRYKKSDFNQILMCGNSKDLILNFNQNGEMYVYKRTQNSDCAEKNKGSLIGTGSWKHENRGAEEYTFLEFPKSVSPARYDSKFSDEQYAQGIKIGLQWDNGIDQWVYKIPTTTVLEKEGVTVINKTAADAIKQSAGW